MAQLVKEPVCSHGSFHPHPSSWIMIPRLIYVQYLGHKLGLVPQIARNLYNLFKLFYVCHMAGYLSSVSYIQLSPSLSGKSSSLFPRVPLSQDVPSSNPASAYWPSDFYWQRCIYIVHKRLSLQSALSLTPVWRFYFDRFFETGSHKAQGGLKLTRHKMPLNSWSFCLHPPNAKIYRHILYYTANWKF